MEPYEVTFKAKVWIWDGSSPWYFVTVPEKESSDLKKMFGAFHRGWGSIPVRVTIGASSWRTSIFWEKKGTYILPIKKEIRKNEDIGNTDLIIVNLFIENVT